MDFGALVNLQLMNTLEGLQARWTLVRMVGADVGAVRLSVVIRHDVFGCKNFVTVQTQEADTTLVLDLTVL